MLQEHLTIAPSDLEGHIVLIHFYVRLLRIQSLDYLKSGFIEVQAGEIVAETVQNVFHDGIKLSHEDSIPPLTKKIKVNVSN